MKKWEQDILSYIVPVIFAITYLTFWGPEISWSENALMQFNSLLNMALCGFVAIFLIVRYKHPHRDLEIYKWAGKSIRLKHLSSYTAYSFFLVLIFSLNTDLFPEWAHMVATGNAVGGLTFMVLGWFKTWTFDWWVFTSFILLSVIALVIAFWFRTIDVKYPEFALAIIGLIFLYRIRK